MSEAPYLEQRDPEESRPSFSSAARKDKAGQKEGPTRKLPSSRSNLSVVTREGSQSNLLFRQALEGAATRDPSRASQGYSPASHGSSPSSPSALPGNRVRRRTSAQDAVPQPPPPPPAQQQQPPT